MLKPMQPMPEQIAPLGSHQFPDQLNLAYHREVAVRLLADPQAVIQTALANLQRWRPAHEGTGSEFALEEWRILLETKTVRELVEIITQDSDEGQRLRQSTSFPGILSSEERREILDAYHRAAILHNPDHPYSQSCNGQYTCACPHRYKMPSSKEPFPPA